MFCLRQQVSLALTLGVLFSFSAKMNELFSPTIWIPFEAALVMANQSGSVISSCMLRMVGTVLVSITRDT